MHAPDAAVCAADCSAASLFTDTTVAHVTPDVHVSPSQTLPAGTPAQPPLIAAHAPPPPPPLLLEPHAEEPPTRSQVATRAKKCAAPVRTIRVRPFDVNCTLFDLLEPPRRSPLNLQRLAQARGGRSTRQPSRGAFRRQMCP